MRIEACITEIRSWLAHNMLKLNCDKTEFLVLRTPREQCPQIDSIQVVSDHIKPSYSAKNIGVIFDQHMSLDQHVANICKASYYHLRNIAKITNCLSKPDIEILVHAFITNKLDNCNSLLYGIPEFLLDRLQNVQNSAARLITRTKKYDHITPILKILHWIPVRQRIIFKLLLLTYKALHGLAPGYIRDMLQTYKPTRELRSSTRLLLRTPPARLVRYGERSFQYIAPRLWNSLPEEIRRCESVASFKTNIKTYLFNQAYNLV